LQQGLLVGRQQVEAGEEGLVHVEGQLPVVQGAHGPTEGHRSFVKARVPVLRAERRPEGRLGGLHGVIGRHERLARGEDGRVALEAGLNRVLHGHGFCRSTLNGQDEREDGENADLRHSHSDYSNIG